MSIMLPQHSLFKCGKCGEPALVRVKYAKTNFCREHFLDYIERRVDKTIERYRMLENVKKLLVGVSGGKDSLSLLYILSKLRSRYGVELIGFHLDLGVPGYSEESKKVVLEACRENSVQCIVISLREAIGYSLPELVEKVKRPPCSICGLLKRYFINNVALEIGADAVALGHHIDDILAFAVKDFLLQDLLDLSKMKPVSLGKEGFLVKKLKILYEVYESDLELYAQLMGIKVVGTQCPFKYNDPFLTSARRMIEEIEEHAPGFKIMLARKLSVYADKLGVEGELTPCKYCGSPSSSGVCGVCRVTMRISGHPMGFEIKGKIRSLIKSGGV